MPAGLGSTLLLLPVSAQHCCFVGSVGWTADVLARFRLMMVASMVSSRKSGRCRLHSLLKGVSAVQSMMRLLRLSRSEWKEKIALRYFMASRQTQRLLIRWCLHQSERGNGMKQELCGTHIYRFPWSQCFSLKTVSCLLKQVFRVLSSMDMEGILEICRLRGLPQKFVHWDERY